MFRIAVFRKFLSEPFAGDRIAEARTHRQECLHFIRGMLGNVPLHACIGQTPICVVGNTGMLDHDLKIRKVTHDMDKLLIHTGVRLACQLHFLGGQNNALAYKLNFHNLYPHFILFRGFVFPFLYLHYITANRWVWYTNIPSKYFKKENCSSVIELQSVRQNHPGGGDLIHLNIVFPHNFF